MHLRQVTWAMAGVYAPAAISLTNRDMFGTGFVLHPKHLDAVFHARRENHKNVISEARDLADENIAYCLDEYGKRRTMLGDEYGFHVCTISFIYSSRGFN
ncbi:hypothetical protein NX059_002460 [Plenodomus lindquistii]|nr:hypothetical protein NX059_002460 [Plenodomus lindquistii]